VFAYEAARIVDLPVEGPYAVVAADDHAGDDGTTVLLSERLAACGIDSAWQVRANTLVGLLSLDAISPPPPRRSNSCSRCVRRGC
jgi:hypothetical protein